MPFRASFDCLWCGRPHTTRGDGDLEGWSQLCPDCVGRAQENEFLRYRVRDALAERSAKVTPAASGIAVSPPLAAEGEAEALAAYYEARAPEYDDWYLRRGHYSHGPIDDVAWHTELDQATLWLDDLPWHGEIVELAAGTGWWSPLLASRGELSIYDRAPAALDRARDRLVAHNLRAHIHVRDAWDEPDRAVDCLFAGFWLSHIRRDRLAQFLDLTGRWLKPGGLFAFIDSQQDAASGAEGNSWIAQTETAVRRLADGREYRIPKVYYASADLEAAMVRHGFQNTAVTATNRFFLMGRGHRNP